MEQSVSMESTPAPWATIKAPLAMIGDAPIHQRLELRRGIALEDVRQIEDLHRLIPGGPDEVIYIHGMKFIPRWVDGSLVLTPKNAEDMLVSIGWTREEYEEASTGQVFTAARNAWAAAGLPTSWSKKE